jgi:glutamate 5-kinase
MTISPIYHPDIPTGDFYVWDGRRSQPLYRESPNMYTNFLPDTDDALKAVVVKTSTGLFFHRDNKSVRTFLKAHTEDLTTAATSQDRLGYGKGVLWVYSGARRFGRKARLKRGEVERPQGISGYSNDGLSDAEILEEKRQDAKLGKGIVETLVGEYFDQLGQKAAFVYVTPEQYESVSERRAVAERCVGMMNEGVLVVMNEDDEVRQQHHYETNKTFDENDGLTSLTSSAIHEVYGPTIQLTLTDQRGIRPIKYWGGEKEEVEKRVIRLVHDSEKLVSQSAPAEFSANRGTSGGFDAKIMWAERAAKEGVFAYIGNGAYHIIDRKSPVRAFRPLLAVLERKTFGSLFVPPELYPEIV